MYPTLTDLLHDLLGFTLPLPIQTFGLFLVLSFAAAAYTLKLELKRMQHLGILKSQQVTVELNKPATGFDYFSATLFGFFIGYKILYALLNYADFAADPAALILSKEGNLWLGIFCAAIGFYLRFRESKADELKGIETKNMEVNPYQHVGNITMLAALVGVLGAKLFHILENLGDFIAHPIDSIFSFSGLTFYGGLICAGATVLYYANKKGIAPWRMFDATAPGLMLAYGVGRMGCHLSGDGDWGIVNLMPKPTWLAWAPDWLWAYGYPHNVVGDGVRMPDCEGPHCFELIPPVFPTPFYEFIMCCTLFFVLWCLRKHFKLVGVLTGVYLILNGAERFLIEHIRVNNMLDFGFFSATQAEVISFALMISGLVIIAYMVLVRKEKILSDKHD
ncbi:MAG: prolipoprotein diacylglyceryl transferase [Bacteroidia bacterium]|nr:prolipoprotein diacylglyceryl transferase [Bacteroidia bacterium]